MALREALVVKLQEQKDSHQIEEVIQDMCDGIKTPTPPLPDLEDPVIRKQEFEALNPGHYYTEHAYQLFKYLHGELKLP